MKKHKNLAVDDLFIRCTLIHGRGRDPRRFIVTIDEADYQALGHALTEMIWGSDVLELSTGLESELLSVDSGSSQSSHCANNEVDLILAKPMCTVIIPFQGPAPDYASETSYYPFEIVRDVARIFIAFVRHNAASDL